MTWAKPDLSRANHILKVVLFLLLITVAKAVTVGFILNISALLSAQQIISIAQANNVAPWRAIFSMDTSFLWMLEDESSLEKASRLVALGRKIDPENTRWDATQGHIYLAQGNPSQAATMFERRLSPGYDHTEFDLFFMGVVYKSIGDHDRAIRAWQQTPDVDHFFLMTGLRKYYKLGDPQSALPYLVTAAEIAPQQCEPSYRIGIIWIELEQFSKAIQALSDAKKLNCSDALLGEIYYQRGKLLASEGREAEAIADLRQSLFLDHSDLKRLLVLGDVLVKSGTVEWDEAHNLFLEAISLAPENVSGYVRLCDFERRRENYTEAVSWCSQAVESFPEDALPYFYMGRIYLQQAKFMEAINWFEQATARDAKNANFWNRLGDAYWGAENPNRAIAAYQAALEINPAHPYSQRRLRELVGE